MSAILITGAAGYIGSRLTHRLLERGDVVVCALRGARPRPGSERWAPTPRERIEAVLAQIEPDPHRRARWGQRLQVVHYDIEELLEEPSARARFVSEVRQALAEAGAPQLDDTIHVAADMSMSPDPARRPKSMRRNAQGTRVTCELALELGTRCFTDISTWYVCGAGEVLTRVRTREELAALDWLNFYQESKAWGEREALDAVEAHNAQAEVPVTLRIVRPSIVVHEMRLSTFGWNLVELQLLYNRLLWLYVRLGLRHFSEAPTIPMPPQLNPDQHMNLVPISMVERGLLELAGDASRGGVFHLSAPHAEPLEQILRDIFAAYYPLDNLVASFGANRDDPAWVRALWEKVVDVILGDLDVLVPFGQEVFSAGQIASRGDTASMGPAWERAFPTRQQIRATFVLEALEEAHHPHAPLGQALAEAAVDAWRSRGGFVKESLRRSFDELLRRPTAGLARRWKREVAELFSREDPSLEPRRRYIWGLLAHHPRFLALLDRDPDFARSWRQGTRALEQDPSSWARLIARDPGWAQTWRRQLAALEDAAPDSPTAAAHLEALAPLRPELDALLEGASERAPDASLGA